MYYVIRGSDQINPWGFMEKTLNVLTDDDYTNIRESEPLWEKFNLVMNKIVEKNSTLGNPWVSSTPRLGFGTYLAYFSRLLAKPAYSGGNMFLMNKEMTKEENEIRQYMNQALTNLAQRQQLKNISIWELVKYLHTNPDETDPDEFSRPLQDEYGCWTPHSYNFMKAWEYYSKAYFAN